MEMGVLGKRFYYEDQYMTQYGGMNRGFHIGDEYCTIDIDLTEMSEEMARAVELEANGYVFKNITVYSYLTDRDTAGSLPLRTKIKRIVEIEDIDMCACCGVHLKTTGETGLIPPNLSTFNMRTGILRSCS
jgi:alanyl-tRNA synthetase